MWSPAKGIFFRHSSNGWWYSTKSRVLSINIKARWQWITSWASWFELAFHEQQQKEFCLYSLLFLSTNMSKKGALFGLFKPVKRVEWFIRNRWAFEERDPLLSYWLTWYDSQVELRWEIATHSTECFFQLIGCLAHQAIHFFPSDYGKLYWSDGVAESMNWWELAGKHGLTNAPHRKGWSQKNGLERPALSL